MGLLAAFKIIDPYICIESHHKSFEETCDKAFLDPNHISLGPPSWDQNLCKEKFQGGELKKTEKQQESSGCGHPSSISIQLSGRQLAQNDQAVRAAKLLGQGSYGSNNTFLGEELNGWGALGGGQVILLQYFEQRCVKLSTFYPQYHFVQFHLFVVNGGPKILNGKFWK